MCDLNRVSGLLSAAKIAYLATLIMLGIGMANSASLFAAAANVPLMIAAIASTALSTGMYVAALAELDKCATGPCASELQGLRGKLVGLLATMAIFTASLIGVAIVAAVPFAGAVAIGSVIALFIGFTALVSGGLEWIFANAVQAFNDCRARAGSTTISGAVVALAYIVMVAAVLFTVGGGLAGKVPWNIHFEW